MEYDERLALFRQTRLNPFDRGEEEDGPQGGKTPPLHGKVCGSSSQANHMSLLYGHFHTCSSFLGKKVDALGPSAFHGL